MRTIKLPIVFAREFLTLAIRGFHGEYVSVPMAASIAKDAAIERTRNYANHEQALMLATGVSQPRNWIEALRSYRAKRTLNRKAMKLANAMGDFEIMDKVHQRRKRLNYFISQSDSDSIPLEHVIIDARWMLAVAEHALCLKQHRRKIKRERIS